MRETSDTLGLSDTTQTTSWSWSIALSIRLHCISFGGVIAKLNCEVRRNFCENEHGIIEKRMVMSNLITFHFRMKLKKHISFFQFPCIFFSQMATKLLEYKY